MRRKWTNDPSLPLGAGVDIFVAEWNKILCLAWYSAKSTKRKEMAFGREQNDKFRSTPESKCQPHSAIL